MPAPIPTLLKVQGQGRDGRVPTADGTLPLLFLLAQPYLSTKPGRVYLGLISERETVAGKYAISSTFRMEMN